MTRSLTPEPGPERSVGAQCAPKADACKAADPAPCSDLYKAPVPFQGRSLQGAPHRNGPKELARPLDATMPVDDLVPLEPGPVEPDLKFIVACSHVTDGGAAETALVERQVAYAESIRTIPGRRRDPMRASDGGCARSRATQAANDHRTAYLSANCTVPLAFGSGSFGIMSLVGCEAGLYPDEDAKADNPCPGADPRNVLDLSRAARCVSGTRERKPDRRNGFGQVVNGWNESPISSRERILNALTRDESVRPDRVAALGGLPASPRRSLMPVFTAASGGRRHARERMRNSRVRRVLQLIEILDHAAVVV